METPRTSARGVQHVHALSRRTRQGSEQSSKPADEARQQAVVNAGRRGKAASSCQRRQTRQGSEKGVGDRVAGSRKGGRACCCCGGARRAGAGAGGLRGRAVAATYRSGLKGVRLIAAMMRKKMLATRLRRASGSSTAGRSAEPYAAWSSGGLGLAAARCPPPLQLLHPDRHLAAGHTGETFAESPGQELQAV
jgi:hypothetical protein